MKEKTRINLQTGISWEPLRGYSRAVLVGDIMYISGTTAINNKGEVIAPNDPYLQTKYVISIIREILESEEFSLADVVRTRLFVTKLADWESYAAAHRELFANIRPASSIVEVNRLMDPRLVIEIEAEAVRGYAKKVSKQIPPFDIKLK